MRGIVLSHGGIFPASPKHAFLFGPNLSVNRYLCDEPEHRPYLYQCTRRSFLNSLRLIGTSQFGFPGATVAHFMLRRNLRRVWTTIQQEMM
jgi:hypothetical protein